MESPYDAALLSALDTDLTIGYDPKTQQVSITYRYIADITTVRTWYSIPLQKRDLQTLIDIQGMIE